MKTKNIEVVLFDLGGVIVQFQDPGYFAQMLGETDDARALAKWVTCPALQLYEKGEIDRQEFARGIIAYFEIDTLPEKFLTNFLVWPQDVFPGSEEVISNIQSDIRVGCLSNTSEFHWHNQKSSALLKKMFEHRFLSFQMGYLKPDAAIYLEVTKRLGCAANAILFFDDNIDNVKSAVEFGFNAHLVRGTSEAHNILKKYNLLK